MDSAYRLVHTIKEENEKKDRGSCYLQFVEYISTAGSEEPLEVIKNSIKLRTGQIFCDALNYSNGRDKEKFQVTEDTTFDYLMYIDFIKAICKMIPNEAMMFCYNLYSEFYESGRSKDAFVPTMSVRLELDCSEEGWLVEYFYFDDFENLLVYDFYAAIKEKRAIKPCSNCGLYFLAQARSDEIYCSKPCRDAVSKVRSRSYYASNDDLELLKRRISSRLQQRRNVNNEALREDREAVHEAFKKEARAWKRRIKEGKASQGDYARWLEEQDSKYNPMNRMI